MAGLLFETYWWRCYKTKTHHNRTVHALALCTLYRTAAVFCVLNCPTGTVQVAEGRMLASSGVRLLVTWRLCGLRPWVTECISVLFGTVAISNGLLRLRNWNFAWSCSIKIGTHVLPNGVYKWRVRAWERRWYLTYCVMVVRGDATVSCYCCSALSVHPCDRSAAALPAVVYSNYCPL